MEARLDNYFQIKFVQLILTGLLNLFVELTFIKSQKSSCQLIERMLFLYKI